MLHVENLIEVLEFECFPIQLILSVNLKELYLAIDSSVFLLSSDERGCTTYFSFFIINKNW